MVGGLPKGAIAIRFDKDFNAASYQMPGMTKTKFRERLPPGNWQLLGKPGSVTEEKWKGVIEMYPIVESYVYYKDTVPYLFDTATESGLSLIECECFDYQNPIIFYEPK